MMRGPLAIALGLGLTVAVTTCLAAAPALAAPGPTGCWLPGYVSQPGASPCPQTSPPVARTDFLGPVGGVLGSLTNGTVNDILRALIDAAISSAAGALRLTGSLLASSTRPQLLSSWFSAAYWRVTSVSVLLTLPFLFAAAVHALLRSDLTLIGRAAFGYLPLALLGVCIAAPVTTLVLSATDEMSAFVAGAAGGGDSSFLARAASALSTPSLIHGDLFVAFIVAILTIVATVSLWIELLIRGAAVDVIVLMLPLFFAAMVWPARRVWAIRAIETLVALILSKFAIVAVLTLGGAALAHLANGPGAVLTGATLIVLATLAPWALLRILPLHEVAAAAAGGLSQAPRSVIDQASRQLRPGGRQAAERDGDLADEPSADAGVGDLVVARLAALDDAMRMNRTSRRDPAGEETVDEPTSAGLDAVTQAGRTRTPANVGPSVAAASDRGLDDGRPPIERPFDGSTWEGFVIGDEGDDRMAPPVIEQPPEPTSGADPVTPPPPLEPPGSDERDPLAPPEEET